MGGIIDVQDIYNTRSTWAELCSSQFSVSLARWSGYTLTQGQHGHERRLFPGLGLVIRRVAALVRQWAVWVLNPAPWHSVQQVDVSDREQRSWDICSHWKHCWVIARTLPKLRHLLLHLNQSNGIVTVWLYTHSIHVGFKTVCSELWSISWTCCKQHVTSGSKQFQHNTE